MPAFKYDKPGFVLLFDEIFDASLRSDSVEISGVGFWDHTAYETAYITVIMSRSAPIRPKITSSYTVTTMLPEGRDQIENLFFRSIAAVMNNLDIPETEMEYLPLCQKDVTLKLYNPAVKV